MEITFFGTKCEAHSARHKTSPLPEPSRVMSGLRPWQHQENGEKKNGEAIAYGKVMAKYPEVEITFFIANTQKFLRCKWKFRLGDDPCPLRPQCGYRLHFLRHYLQRSIEIWNARD